MTVVTIAVCLTIVIALCITIFLILRKKPVERPFTFDEELRLEKLDPGFYMICGRQRVGKGSFGCAIMDTDATYHGEERLALAQNFTDYLNSIGYDLDVPDFAYRSKNDMLLTPEYRHTYHTDIPQFSLPDDEADNTVQYFPPYTVLHFEEMDAYMNARTWKDNPRKKANIIDAIKWLGHNDLSVIGDAQVFSRLDAAVRALTTDIFYIIKREDYYDDDRPRKWWQFHKPSSSTVTRTKWTFLWIKNQLFQQAKEMSSFGDFINPADYIKKCEFNYYGNIYERYNSKSGRKYWYKGIKEYSQEMHPSDNDMSRDSVDDYCSRNARHSENASKDTE